MTAPLTIEQRAGLNLLEHAHEYLMDQRGTPDEYWVKAVEANTGSEDDWQRCDKRRCELIRQFQKDMKALDNEAALQLLNAMMREIYREAEAA